MTRVKQSFRNAMVRLYTLPTHLGFKYPLSIYDEEFFAINQKEGRALAKWFVPLLRNTFPLTSLVDVGCGTGHYLRALMDSGVRDVAGLEGSPHAFNHLLVDRRMVTQHDLREPYQWKRQWDLALSIEVAEHIERFHVENYIRILTGAANTVVITAAHPSQGGTAHVNEQTQDWWKERFYMTSGFVFDEGATGQLRAGITQAKADGQFVTEWYEPNIMVFRKPYATH